MIKLAEQHAEISGSVERCGLVSTDDFRQKHASAISQWVYPGTVHRLFGYRGSYEKVLLDRLSAAFNSGRAAGCPGLVGHYEILLRQIDDNITSFLAANA